MTGATGFLGSALAEGLSRLPGISTIALLRPESSAPAGLPWRPADLTNQTCVQALLAELRPDFVLHAAGRVHGTALELYRDNTVTTVVIPEAVLASCPSAI